MRGEMSDRPKILIADDMEMNLILLEKVLSGFDVDFFRASCGKEAISLSQKHQFVLMLLDVRMPDIDGIEVVRLLRDNPQTKYLPVILISAMYHGETDIIKGIESGAVDFITKPVAPEILKGKVRVYLNLYLQRESLEKEIKNRILIEEENHKLQRKIQISSRMASMGMLASGIGHEINNPLTIISGSVLILKDMIAREKQDPKKIGSVVERIENASDRIVNIVKGLRSYLNVDDVKLVALDLQKILEETLTTCSSMFKKAKIKVVKNFRITNAQVLGNRGKVQQIFLNLLSNAHDGIDGDEGELTISLKEEDEKIIIKVSDNGRGIPPEDLPKIFDTFFTTKDVGKGAGLGLGMVYSVVEEMKGEIDVNSELGVGTTFSISLPIIKSQIDGALEESFLGNILIVDDEEGVREVLKHKLESFGYHVDDVESGEQAMVEIQKKEYKFVITDLYMPQMDGIRLMNLIRENKDYPCKVVISSGDISDPRVAEADGVIEKPFNRQEILKLLKELED